MHPDTGPIGLAMQPQHPTGHWLLDDDATSPPFLEQPPTITASTDAHLRKKSLPQIQTAITAGFVSHITPPETPSSPFHDAKHLPLDASLFHNYLRAMHSFDPASDAVPGDDVSQSATALRQGDLILVHCVHANGWADGTVLNTGTRGWLPTNYCEAYDHPYLRNLLNAMTQFWDLLGANEDANLSTFVRQDYIRGLIAGVRYLLERADCLHRDSPSVKHRAGLRRMRKGLLADLSSLVQIAKRLQDTISEPFAGEVIHVLLDDLISKAFKVVTRAVGFVDVWTQESSNAKPALTHTLPAQSPSTSPSNNNYLAIDTKSSGTENPHSAIDSAVQFPEPPSNPAAHTTSACADPELHRLPPARSSMVFTPPDGLVAHRVSLVAKESRGIGAGPLASEQLAKVHDICISHIGAFIGHHLHSRPCSELVATTERLVQACRNMLSIIDEVYAHGAQKFSAVEQARNEFERKVDELAKSTKDVFRFSDSPDDEIVMLPNQAEHLIQVSTSLIRNTGECVVRTRQLIEQLGDFQLKSSALGSTQPGDDAHGYADNSKDVSHERTEDSSKRLSLPKRLSRVMGPPPPPLPKDDIPSSPAERTIISTIDSFPAVPTSSTASVPSRHVPGPLTIRKSAGRGSQASNSVVESLKSPRPARSDSTSPGRKNSIGMSITGSTDTYYSNARDSSITEVSQGSTRATTPEKDACSSNSALMNSFASISSMRSFATESLATEDSVDPEAHLLQKTYANELTFNKDGQVTGGTLPALVEQLTMHDSAPDAQFLIAFFLTFRKFSEPREVAQALIDRFEYIGDSRDVGTPVRLRIYNVFKGWLETYWNAEADKIALGEIRFFALHRLKQVLPTAGDRLVELTRRISEGYSNGTISGPLVSGVGKTSMSIGSQSEEGLPESLITGKQLNALRIAIGGGSQCNIVDLDATELARQLSMMVMKAYCDVRPDELLSMDWSKPNTKKARNIRRMCLLNTDLAHLVGDTILTPDDAKKRAKVIGKWVKIAAACLELCNYDSVMAIMCTLDSSPVQRLKKTWEAVNKKTKVKKDEINETVDMSRNYAALRRLLETPTAPCIPFLGVYLTDLTFVIAGNPKKRELPGSASETGETVTVINFDMYMRMAKIISHLQKFQVAYRLKPIPEMQNWIGQHLQRMRDGHDDMVSTLHRRSLQLEPKDERKQSLMTSSFRSDSEERPRTAAGHRHDVQSHTPALEKFDLFLKSASFSMRSHSTLPTPEEHPARTSVQ